MSWQQLDEDLSFSSRDFAGHGVDLFHEEIMLMHECYPDVGDAAKECIE